MADDSTRSELPARDAELSEANRRLRDSARRRDELLAGIARELRDPITAARAELRRLSAGARGPLADAQRVAVDEVERQLGRVSALQRDVAELHDLTVGRAELRRTRTDLAEVCSRVADAVDPVARGRGVAVDRELPGYPVPVVGDADRLREAIEGLALQCVSAAPPESRLVVRLDALPGGGRVTLETREAAGAVPALSVGGSVSLALCREIVELHGGVLGATAGRVEVWLVEDAAAAPAVAASAPGGRPHILVVEDDGPTREALSEALADTYDVEPAVDGVEGVEAARARRPDVIVMDLFLPRLDGFEALEALRNDPSTADVPVILVSGRGDDLTRAKSLDLGAIDFLQKPYSERELRARIERTLRLAQRQNQLQALAETDALTGLANRRAFLGRLAHEVKRARRYGTPLSCIMADMDRLKPINDELGHAAGDRAIAALATVLRSELRETDFGARYGGDEFVVLLPHTTAAEGRALAERVCERLRGAALEIDGKPVPLQASFGVAELPEGSPDEAAEALVHHADEALYASKAAGRGRVSTWGVAAATPPAA